MNADEGRCTPEYIPRRDAIGRTIAGYMHVWGHLSVLRVRS